MREGLTISQLEIGQAYWKKITITEKMVKSYAEVTGDHNPVHLDEEYARRNVFGSRVAHGMLVAGILSGILGTEFPGIGTIYVSQTLRFLKPVFIGDEVTFRITVSEILKGRNRVRLETVCLKRVGQVVLDGEALIVPPSS